MRNVLQHTDYYLAPQRQFFFSASPPHSPPLSLILLWLVSCSVVTALSWWFSRCADSGEPLGLVSSRKLTGDNSTVHALQISGVEHPNNRSWRTRKVGENIARERHHIVGEPTSPSVNLLLVSLWSLPCWGVTLARFSSQNCAALTAVNWLSPFSFLPW